MTSVVHWQSSATYRRTDPHVRIHKLAVENLARATRLLRTVHIFKAAMVLGKLVGSAVLATRLVRVHVHLVLDVALHQPGHSLVRFALLVLVRIATPNLSVGASHHLTQ